MTDLLDTIDQSLQEVEEQLLAEFTRIRNSLSDSPFEPMDTGIKTGLTSVLDELHHMLEHSGDKLELQLQTDIHEVLYARMGVLRQLFNARIPTAYLQEVHSDVKTTRRSLEARAVAMRGEDKPAGPVRISRQEEKKLAPMQIYLDNGIYSASRELAMLATRITDAIERGELADHQAEKKLPPPMGRAQFEARDLSRQAPEARTTPKQALTPEDIRRKLEANKRSSSGASKFEARDLSTTIRPTSGVKSTGSSRAYTTPDAKPGPESEAEKEDVAHTPEEIRRKLAARQNQTTSGRASFVSRDIEPIPPKVTPKKPTEEKPEPSKSGKAVFEARDLSDPPKKR